MTCLALALAGFALAETAWEAVALGGDLEKVVVRGMAMGAMAMGFVAAAPAADETMANSVLVSQSRELGPTNGLFGLVAFRC